MKYVVEFPVEVGQKVWRIVDGKITETFVDKLIVKAGGLYMKLACNAFYETSCRSIGKTIFLLQEEAQKQLS
jgi:hypothetical protein